MPGATVGDLRELLVTRYGDPMDRAVEKVVWDMKNGLVSVKGAEKDYGVVISDPDQLTVDMAATETLRAARRAAAAN